MGIMFIKNKNSEKLSTGKSSLFNLLPIKIIKTIQLGTKKVRSTELNYNNPSSLRLFKSLRPSK